MAERVHIGERAVAYETRGPTDGSPVFLFHGTPGSRLGPRPTGLALAVRGVRLITYDRPGYGESDRLAGRRVVDAAEDVAAIADHLGLARFAVVGRSGGGPHALACAAELPDRVVAAASLVGLAPRDAEGLNWYDGMAEANRLAHQEALAGIEASAREPLLDRLAELTEELFGSNFIRTAHGAALPDVDRVVLGDAGIRALLADNFRAAAANEDNLWERGPGDTGAVPRRVLAGWVDDILAFAAPWGFDVRSIGVPVWLWHGEDDVFSPPAHSRWLRDRTPRAELTMRPRSAHMAAIAVLPDVLDWLLRHWS